RQDRAPRGVDRGPRRGRRGRPGSGHRSVRQCMGVPVHRRNVQQALSRARAALPDHWCHPGIDGGGARQPVAHNHEARQLETHIPGKRRSMETQTLVQASAEIITIHTLKKNDVYRRLETSSYKGDQVMYGVVTDIGHNGEDAFIVSLEFDPNDSAGDITPKTFGTSSNLALFACTPEEFTAAAADVRVKKVRAI